MNPKINTDALINFIKWPFSVLFFITALRALLIDKLIFVFICYAAIGLLLFPPLTEKCRSLLPFLKNRIYKGILIFVLIMLAGLGFN